MKIAVIGAGSIAAALITQLEKTSKEVVMLQTPDRERLKEIEYKRMGPPTLLQAGEKPFICKGKHQYTDQKGIWVCECGRKLQ